MPDTGLDHPQQPAANLASGNDIGGEHEQGDGEQAELVDALHHLLSQHHGRQRWPEQLERQQRRRENRDEYRRGDQQQEYCDECEYQSRHPYVALDVGAGDRAR